METRVIVLTMLAGDPPLTKLVVYDVGIACAGRVPGRAIAEAVERAMQTERHQAERPLIVPEYCRICN